jgi:hypothetical protein
VRGRWLKRLGNLSSTLFRTEENRRKKTFAASRRLHRSRPSHSMNVRHHPQLQSSTITTPLRLRPTHDLTHDLTPIPHHTTLSPRSPPFCQRLARDQKKDRKITSIPHRRSLLGSNLRFGAAWRKINGKETPKAFLNLHFASEAGSL